MDNVTNHDSDMVHEHIDRFVRIEGRLGDLEGRQERTETRQETVWRDLYGDDGAIRVVIGTKAQLSLITRLLVIGISIGGLVATVFGIWFQHLESEHKVQTPTTYYVQPQPIPQDATAGHTHY